jgi:hypothetical protein
MKTRVLVSVGAALFIGALALSSVGGAFAQNQPAPMPGGMMSGGGRMMGPGGMMGGMGNFAPGGMMSGTWGPTAPSAQPTVTADQAQQIAQQWLDGYQPSSATETPDPFYGYYTLHITKAGQITGMLSVNAYTGQAWFHTWHGNFVAGSEA